MNTKRPNVRLNIIANGISRIWSATLGLLLIPIYIDYLGIEAYGLVGFSVTLQGIFALLDLGLGMTINRELARLSAIAGTEQAQRDLVRTLETIYWTISISIGLLIVLGSPLIANYWIHPQTLSTEQVQSAVVLIGVMITFQFPYALYQGGITGLQRQVFLNMILIMSGAFRNIGVIFALLTMGATVQVYFGWQVLSSILLTSSLAWYLWHCLPKSEAKATFNKTMIRAIGRFALGMSGITITATLLYSIDKVVLSNRLPLEQFGYYTLAWTVATMVTVIVGPINMAIFPRFSQLVSTQNERDLSHLYHLASQLLAVGIMSVVAVVMLFAREVLLAWTGNATIADEASILLTVMIVANGLNGLVNTPYSVQLAYGWTTLTIYANIICLILLTPILVFLAGPLGGLAGAIFWLIINVGYFLINVNLMHRRILVGEAAQWYWQDNGLPFLGAFTAVAVLRFFYHGASRDSALLIVILAGLLAGVGALLAAPLVRHSILWQIRTRIHRATVVS